LATAQTNLQEVNFKSDCSRGSNITINTISNSKLFTMKIAAERSLHNTGLLSHTNAVKYDDNDGEDSDYMLSPNQKASRISHRETIQIRKGLGGDRTLNTPIHSLRWAQKTVELGLMQRVAAERLLSKPDQASLLELGIEYLLNDDEGRNTDMT